MNHNNRYFGLMILLLVAMITILLVILFHDKTTPLTATTYRLIGTRNIANCSPANADVSIIMTPSIGDPETLTIQDGETFMFNKEFIHGETYIIEQTGTFSGATCTIYNSSGTFGEDDITNLLLECKTQELFSIGGSYDITSVPDQTFDMVINPGLTNEETISLTLSAGTGSFEFVETFPSGTTYAFDMDRGANIITDISNGSGTIQCADVINIDFIFVDNDD